MTQQTILMISLVAAVIASSPSHGVMAQRIDAGAAAASIIEKARSWAGGAALEQVRTIAASGRQGSQPYEYRLMLPDRFQTTQREFGIVNTLDGKNFWQEAPIVAPPEMRDRARRSLSRGLLLRSVTTLLRSPAGERLTFAKRAADEAGDLVGPAVDVAGPDGFALTLVFDPGDGHLIGFLQEVVLARTGFPEVRGREVAKLLDYRTISGVRIAHRIESASPLGDGSDKTATLVCQFDEIEVNTLRASDFRQRAPGRLSTIGGRYLQ